MSNEPGPEHEEILQLGNGVWDRIFEQGQVHSSNQGFALWVTLLCVFVLMNFFHDEIREEIVQQNRCKVVDIVFVIPRPTSIRFRLPVHVAACYLKTQKEKKENKQTEKEVNKVVFFPNQTGRPYQSLFQFERKQYWEFYYF